MGWRIAGVIVALWAFNLAMHQPIFAVFVGLLAGWLFGRGRQSKTLPTESAAVSSSRSSARPRLAATESKEPRAAPPAADSRAGERTPSVSLQTRESERALGGPRPPGLEVAPAPLSPATIAPERRHSRPTVGTRTSSTVPDVELEDPYADKEKRWSRTDQVQLLDLYEQRKNVFVIAQALHVDQKQVAIKLIRLLLAPSGDIENADGCPRHGKQYTKEELGIMEDLQRKGMRLRTIANEVQRSQLGVGWRLLDMHLPRVPAGLRGGLRSDS